MNEYILYIIVIIIAFLSIRAISANSQNAELPETDTELWIMIEMDDYFLSKKEYEIENKIKQLSSKYNFGELDGHSSGSHQFDINLFNIQDYEKSKELISEMLTKTYPKLNFMISNSYETTYDK